MSKHYDIGTIQAYLAGKLDAERMHQLERDALDDPMLQDAIDGFEASNELHLPQLSLLQQRLEARIAQQEEKRNHFYFGRQRLAIASVAGLLFIVVCILFWMINFPLRQTNEEPAIKEVVTDLQLPVKIYLESGDLEPEIGWEDYHHYLKINNQANLSQERIEISFRVIDHRPSSIKVIALENKNVNEEIIRLLESGPNWNGSEGILVIEF